MIPKSLIRSDERGQALAEFAIIVPILITLLTAIFQVGVVFNQWIQVTDAARAGARVASVSRTAANRNTLTVNAARAAAPGLNAASLTVPNPTSTWVQGSTVTVTVSYPASVSIYGIPAWSGTLSSSTTYRVE